MTSALFTHHWQHRTGQVDHTEQVSFHLVAEILRCHLLERSGVAVTSVVDQHIEATKGIERVVDRALRGNLIGDIECDGTDPVSMALDQIYQAFGIAGASNKTISRGKDRLADQAPKAARSAGYQPDF